MISFGSNSPDSRPLLMGIVNVTPDSFSDGGQFLDVATATEHALQMVEDGADVLDVGGESTRPGAVPVSVAEQIKRVVPVIERLAERCRDATVISVDTREPAVASAALTAGARVVNDISGGVEEGMLARIAEHEAAVVLMHMQGRPQTMQDQPHYNDVVGEVRDFLLRQVDRALAAGIASTRIAIDPGIGFGKTRRHNLSLLAALDQFVATGIPVLLGTSRKRFMGAICQETRFTELVGATCATTALGVAAGVRLFRVHDLKANRQAADVAWATLYPDA